MFDLEFAPTSRFTQGHQRNGGATDVRGFTLIEVMIVIAIIAVLSAIALPLLARQQAKSAEAACLAETKSYVSLSVAALLGGEAPRTAPLKACASGDDVTDVSTSVTAVPRAPGRRRTICDVSDTNCMLEP
ncbi:MAG: pilin [Pseudomonadota bacterium]